MESHEGRKTANRVTIAIIAKHEGGGGGELSETEISQSPRTCRMPAARNYARCKSQPRVHPVEAREADR